jgi:hypothetical protein
VTSGSFSAAIRQPDSGSPSKAVQELLQIDMSLPFLSSVSQDLLLQRIPQTMTMEPSTYP